MTLRRFLNFLFPNPWAQCQPPREEERLAQWERRLGEHRAQQRLRAARVAKDFDARAGVRPYFAPRLPQ